MKAHTWSHDKSKESKTLIQVSNCYDLIELPFGDNMSYKLYNTTWNIKTWNNKEHSKY